MSEIRFEAHLCPVHRWTTESHEDRCGVRDETGDRCGERFSHSYTFLPLHEHDEALWDARVDASTQPTSPPPVEDGDWPPEFFITAVRTRGDGEISGYEACEQGDDAEQLRRNGHGPTRRYVPAPASPPVEADPNTLRHERNFWAWKHSRRVEEIRELREELPSDSPNYLEPGSEPVEAEGEEETRVFSFAGVRIRVGSRVEREEGGPGTVTKIEDPEVDADDEGRPVSINPAVHVQWDNAMKGCIERVGTVFIGERPEIPDFECEELDLAPTQPDPVEAEARGEDALEGLPADLATALRDPTIIIDRDRESRLADGRTLAEHLEEWRDAPSSTVSADPRYIAQPAVSEGEQ